uniref:Uncharacterized protein n=1 Tax=Anopheles christyi TaxID=43041 RepID=A0A182KIV6_9DIPT
MRFLCTCAGGIDVGPELGSGVGSDLLYAKSYHACSSRFADASASDTLRVRWTLSAARFQFAERPIVARYAAALESFPRVNARATILAGLGFALIHAHLTLWPGK